MALIGYSYLRFMKKTTGFQHFKVGGKWEHKAGGNNVLPKFTTFSFSTYFVKTETFLITSQLSCSDGDTEKVVKAHMLAWGKSLLLPPGLSIPVSAHTRHFQY